MLLSAFANFLNTTFSGFDYAILAFFHGLCEAAGDVLGPIFKTITLLGEHGLAMIILGVVLLIFKKTRKLGLCVLLAVGIGALFVNLTVKPLVMRLRPYQQSDVFRAWWEAAGAVSVSEYSFPSGHSNVVACAMTAIALCRGKRWILPCAVVTLLVGASRLYLAVHYPTDVLMGFAFGILSGVIAWLIVKLLEKKLPLKAKAILGM